MNEKILKGHEDVEREEGGAAESKSPLLPSPKIPKENSINSSLRTRRNLVLLSLLAD